MTRREGGSREHATSNNPKLEGGECFAQAPVTLLLDGPREKENPTPLQK